MNVGALEIAVVGVGAILPGSPDAQDFWGNVLSGRDLMGDVPASRWRIEDHYAADPFVPDKTYARRGAFLDPVDLDPLAFGIPPKTLPAIDAAQLLALIVAERTLADAAGDRPDWLDGVREHASVLIGSAALELMAQLAARTQHPAWRKALRETGIDEHRAQEVIDRILGQYVPWQPSSFPGSLANVIAGRIANRLDLHGTNCTIDAACASSLSAISMGIDELALGRADLVLAGGVDVTSGPTVFVHFSKTPALSRTGDCRPFSGNADGTMLGEGVVMFALRRLADAEAAGDRIYGVIRGIGSSSDGQGSAIYAPQASGQARALRRAYAVAGYGPETVELIEAHGTGTAAGDAAEFQSLTEVFGETDRTDRQWCALGSVKSQVGHTKCASGAVGLLKALMAVHQQVLPPTIKVDSPDPALSIQDSPFYLNTKARPWVHSAAIPRRAGLSSFGFGGSNFHLTLEEYRGQQAAPRFRATPTELVLYCATTSEGLFTEASQDTTLAALARESQERFDPAAPWRMAIVATDTADLIAKLERARAFGKETFHAPGVWLSGRSPIGGDIGFLFPGQGSQYPGMSADLTMHLPQAMRVWDRIGGWPFDGETLHDVVFPRPVFTAEDEAAQQARLTATEWAQPALAAHSLVLLGLLRELGLTAKALAGHSFGELVALHAAEAYDDETLIHLARKRGQLMGAAAATSPGAMLALACDATIAEAMLAKLELPAWLVNVNAPQQMSVSGSVSAIDEVAALAATQGIIARRLPTSAAFHSPLVAAASAPLADFLSTVDICVPRLPVYGNANALPYPDDPDLIRERLALQLTQPVQFTGQIEAMHDAGIRVFVEVGAGNVLTGLTDQILDGREHFAVSLDRKAGHGLTSLQEGLGQLAVAGVPLNFSPLWTPFGPVPTAPKTKRSGMSFQLDGTSHIRPSAESQPMTEQSEQTQPSVQPMPPPPARAIPAMPSHRDGDVHHALSLIDAITQRIAEAHTGYQAAVTESHSQFLQTARASLATIAQVASGQHASVPAFEASSPALPEMLVPAPALAAISEQVPTAASATDSWQEIATLAGSLQYSSVELGPQTDMGELLLKVVADLTGYPLEMINQDMDFENDLGIDSIKRVQILSHVRERLPNLPTIDVNELGALRTVAQVVTHFQGRTQRLAARESAAASSQDAEGELSRLVITAVPATAPGLALPRLADQVLYVTNDAPEVAIALVAALNERGLRALACDVVPPGARAAISLAGLADGDDRQLARSAFQTACTLARAGEKAAVFVTVQDTGGAFGHHSPSAHRCWHGGYAGLARTVAVEHPDASVKAIDCERAGRSGAVIAESIVDELLHGAAEPDVGLRADGTRFVLRAVPASAQASAPAVDGDSVLVVTGGARGITAEAMLELARRHRPRMLLLGRSELLDDDPELSGIRDREPLTTALASRAHRASGVWPAPAEIAQEAARLLASREVRANLSALSDAGATARYEQCDVRDETAVSALLERVRADWGPITGIVHGAGVIADKPLAEKTVEQFDAVYSTKVDGLKSLLNATAADPLRLICAFGSIVAFSGSIGQADYAMANEVLTQVASAYAAQRPGCTSMAIAWGPWDGGMVDPALAEYFRSVRGYPLISKRAGAHAFAENLSGMDSQIILTPDARMALGGIADRHPQRAEVWISPLSHPHLADHSVAERTVVPLAYVMEWMLRLTGAKTLSDLKVLRPIVADDPNQTLWLRLQRTEDTVTVSGGDGRPCYRATVSDQDVSSAPGEVIAGLQPWTGQIYDGRRLFHGPRFHVITAVDGVSPAGAAATLTGVLAVNWPAEPWQSDVALMDGGMQLPALWAGAIQQQGGLPMGVGEVRVLRRGPAPGPVHGMTRVTHIGSDHARLDITLTDADGGIRAQLLGVEYVTRPDRQD